jgi:hypothetical protein
VGSVFLGLRALTEIQGLDGMDRRIDECTDFSSTRWTK